MMRKPFLGMILDGCTDMGQVMEKEEERIRKAAGKRDKEKTCPALTA